MAASVRYSINGKHDDRGVKRATQSLESLGNVSRKISKLMSGVFVAVGAKLSIDTVNKLTDAFAVQQREVIGLQTAIRNNNNLTSESFGRLTKLASELQGRSIFGDEELIAQEKLLASMGLTEQQIMDTLSAAVDLSSAGVMPLDSAVKNLSKTFSGQRGELGEQIPALRNLSAEQLKNGEAVKVVAEQYKGMAESAASGIEGLKKQVGNIGGDIQEKLGAAFAVIQTSALQKLKPVLEGIDRFLAENQTKIINFFIRFPELASTSFAAVKKLLSTVFSGDYLSTIGGALWKFFLASGKSALTTIGSVLRAIGVTVWEPLKVGFEWTVYYIKDFFATGINFILDRINFLKTPLEAIIQFLIGGINNLIDAVNVIVANDLVKFAVEKLTGKSDYEGIKRVEFQGLDVMDRRLSAPEAPVSTVNKAAIAEAWAEAIRTGSEGSTAVFEELKELAASSGEPLREIVQGVLPELSAILGQELPESLQPILSQLNIGGAEAGAATSSSQFYQTGGNYGGGAGEESPLKSRSESVFSTVFKHLGSFASSIGGMIGSFASVQAILNPFQTILNGMFRVLQPVIDSILKPVLGMLEILGNTLGKILIPVLKPLSSVIEAVAIGFVWFYNNAVRPVGNFFIWLITTINNFFANMINSVIGALNHIPFVDIKWRMSTYSYNDMKLDEISLDSLNSAGSTASGDYANGGSGGSSASYSGSRDVTVNVYIQNSAIAGDSGIRDLAIMLEREARSAAALGQI